MASVHPQVEALLAHRPGKGVLEPSVVQELFKKDLAINFVDQPDYPAISQRYKVPIATLHSIRAQVLMDIVLKRSQGVKESSAQLVSRYYLDGESLQDLSRSVNFSPVVILNNLLETPVIGGTAFSLPVERRNEIKADPDRTLLDPDTWVSGAARSPDFLPCYPPLAPALPNARPRGSGAPDSDEDVARAVHAMLRPILLRLAAEDFVQRYRPQLDRLRKDVRLAMEIDSHHGNPKNDCREVGKLGENMLYEGLDRLGVYYLSEEEQRQKLKAMHKVNVGERTPDARLPVPLLIRGRPVFWIDSKADFGSSYMHQRNLSQLGSYCMRFKQGLVIYWYGYDRSIEDRSPDILVMDHLPDASQILQLPHVPLPFLPPLALPPLPMPPGHAIQASSHAATPQQLGPAAHHFGSPHQDGTGARRLFDREAEASASAVT